MGALIMRSSRSGHLRDSRLEMAGKALAMLVVLALSVTAGGLSACSTSDEALNQVGKAQYILELRALVKRVQRETQLASKLLTVDSVGAAAPVIGEAVDAFDEIVDELERIDPPDEIASVHNRLTAAMRSASDLLNDAQSAVKDRDLASLLVLAPQLSDFRDRFKSVIADYDSAGYQLITAEPEPQTSQPSQP
jgi:hypothetical protein